MARLSNILFVDDLKTYIDFLNTWLEGTILHEFKNEHGDLVVVMYGFEDIVLTIAKPSEESTNTALKVGGSTNTIVIFFDNEAQVEKYYKRAVDAGVIVTSELAYADPNNKGMGYKAGIQDSSKQFWTLIHMKY